MYHLRPILIEEWLPCVPLVLILKNCTFYSHIVFICFMWISEQSATTFICDSTLPVLHCVVMALCVL